MRLNMGRVDRITRSVLAVVVIILYFTGLISGTAAVILGVFAVIFIATSIIGVCPLYIPLGLSTNKEKK